ncbi:Glycoprotein 3-alpha-L-fucosyltransferase A [Echinococcus granulosus]|uniref:Fucosyltransferase n=1 Tax=Echinococcus granulosus TaxID=6210 RepID=W6URV0_ECHGR|nr:Glycoprotein 3-alpha-L-fucosyltransferase A [Echinococcus granulosus]EUB56139.1 Glycoprotein 3-alpha-L-fucosyltransferase A [Echinococcus granulosus]
MNKSAFSSSLACWLISNFLILVILWSSLPDKSPSVEELFSNIRNFFVFQDQLYPYYHVIEQLEWISAFSHNESDLSIVKPPKIFYDGHLLYHVTESQGCRYKCNFTNYLYDLGVGDIAVFSEPFYAVDVEYLRQNGVLIAFESVESPVHMRELTQIQMQQVDVYGGMGRETPPGRDPLQWISEHYKFYLAFENSNCRYYITEKVTVNALRNGMVPIVLGAYKEDYESVLPPYSYINVDDFKSISELVQYLLYLDRNDTAYAEYFAWKEYGDIYVSL